MEIPYGPEARPPERSLDQIRHERALSGREGTYNPGFHTDNLFDQNESAGGEVVDMVTGTPIDNSTETDQTLRERQGAYYITDGPDQPPLPPLKDGNENDAAAAWLAWKEADGEEQEAA